MRRSLPFLLVLATGCGAATPLQPPPPPRVVEVAPVHEEPPPPPPKPPPPPTLEEIATRMASSLDGGAEEPGGSGGTSSPFRSGAPSPDEEAREVMVSYKVVSTSGKFLKESIDFALGMYKHTFALCLVEARGGERKGTVAVNLAFDRDGTPVEPALKSSTFKEKNLTQCIREGFRQIDPASRASMEANVQANGRATVEVSLERPQGF